MHIVVIGWLYVVILMALAEESAVAGWMTFLGYGAAPLALILYLAGTRRRKRRREAQALPPKPPPGS